jgi:hypothetical protein
MTERVQTGAPAVLTLIPLPDWACHGDDVARAAGVVVAQTGCSAPEALGLMRERVTDTGRTMQEIAVAVIERRVRFDGEAVGFGSMLRRRVVAQCVEVGAGDSALNAPRDRRPEARC